jgi:hypothetical protein
MSKKVKQSRKDIFAFIAIVLVMIGALAYGFSTVKTNTVDGPKDDGQMSEECKKLWKKGGERYAEENGC